MTSAGTRVCVIVAGMHRSGTSALSRFLTLLGCAPAVELTGANPSNATGHWEPEPIRALNDAMLAAAGSSWDDWTRLSPDWAATPAASGFFEKACATFAAQYGQANLVVMKDPRVCRMLPFWASVVRACGFEPRIIASIRNPLEVSASLHRRDTTDPSYNYLLWLRHVLDAEFDSRDLPRCFVSYDALLNDWRSVAKSAGDALALEWPGLHGQDNPEIDAYLNRELRHHRTTSAALGADPEHLDWMLDAYAIFARWTQMGEDRADCIALDHLRLQMAQSEKRFGALLNRANQTRAQLAQDAQTISTLKQLLAQTEAMLADQAAKARDLDLRFTELWHRSEAERAELAHARDLLDQIDK